jgi:poly-gamma-glutamate synthesis protein (capsule biosynthesis protein)
MATGDIMLGRYVETVMNRHGEMYPFTFLSDFNLDQDVIIGNLEGPIPETHTKTADFTTNFSFKKSVAPLLKQVGFTHITLANNHTVDKGEPAFWNTKKTLEEVGIQVFGNPRSTAKEFVKLEEINGTEIGLIGLNEAVSSYFDKEAAVQLIDELERINPDRFLIVNIHWGTEYQNTSNKKQKELARSFVNAGADLIIGHHPHVVQEVEVYKNKLIFYSLGNFIFDQYFSKETQEGMVVYFDLKPKTITAKIQGINIDKSRPKPMSDQSIFLKELAARSSKELESQIESGIITLNN